ncbi:MAG: type II CRISPR RNA-guided endonuclease Cas9 [Pseudomonadota bacterium]
MSAYRFSFDLGTNSIGWAVIALDPGKKPIGLVDMGARIFPDGRNPKDKQSLAVARRDARAMRRRRDRYLKRRGELTDVLIAYGLMPADEAARKQLVALDPYHLRASGLDEALPPHHLGRALFHLNQRRGFKSNRKTDRGSDDSGVTKAGIKKLQQALADEGCRTLGELQHRHHQANQSPIADTNPQSVRAKLRGEGAKAAYDFYPSRDAIEDEFNQLWASQHRFHPDILSDEAREAVHDAIFFQRPLKAPPVGKCSFNPTETRLPRALPIAQRFRLLQFIGDLRLVDPQLRKTALDRDQRTALFAELLGKNKVTFKRMRQLLRLDADISFSHESEKQQDFKGDETAAILAHKDRFGPGWRDLALADQTAIVEKLLFEENEEKLIADLQTQFGFDRQRCEAIADAPIPDGYGRLGKSALTTLVAIMEEDGLPYDLACKKAGYDHALLPDGEVFDELPYYGVALERHVAFGDGESDNIEKRVGKIANPTVHIALNQLRKVMNALIARYGSPEQIVMEITRDLKQSREARENLMKQQKKNQDDNDIYRQDLIATGTAINADNMLRMRLWKELNPDNPQARACPFSGEKISRARLFSPEVEIEHILPFSRSLDNSPANKTLCMTWANRAKGNRSPWEAFCRDGEKGFVWDDILARAADLPKNKSWRFAADAMERLKKDGDFLDRQLVDTQYLSRIAREYVSKVCDPNQVWVTPGRLTAWLRRNWGLESILSTGNVTKNRDDHRHHAIDAVVIGVTDRGILNRISHAAAHAESHELDRIVADMPEPFENFRDAVRRQTAKIVVSHKPDTGYRPGQKRGDSTPGALHNDTAYGIIKTDDKGISEVVTRKEVLSLSSIKDIEAIRDAATRQSLLDAVATAENSSAIAFKEALRAWVAATGTKRVRVVSKLSVIPIHDANGRVYKGYKGDGNLCADIYERPDGKWADEIISRFDAVQPGFKPTWKRQYPAARRVMQLFRDDMIRIEHEGMPVICRVARISAGIITLCPHYEANVDARNRDKDDPFKFIYCAGDALRKRHAQKLSVDPAGKVRGDRDGGPNGPHH